MRKFLERYFTFTTGEKNGILVLIFLSVMVLVAPSVYFYFEPVQRIDNSQYKAAIDSFAKAYSKAVQPLTDDSVISPTTAYKVDSIVHKPWRKPEVFEFDPNTIGVKEWVRLGFSERQAMSIEKYKLKGGRFHKPQDLKKLYVMSDENYQRIYPYIRIHKPVKRKED